MDMFFLAFGSGLVIVSVVLMLIVITMIKEHLRNKEYMDSALLSIVIFCTLGLVALGIILTDIKAFETQAAPDCDHTVIIDGTRYIAEECVSE